MPRSTGTVSLFLAGLLLLAMLAIIHGRSVAENVDFAFDDEPDTVFRTAPIATSQSSCSAKQSAGASTCSMVINHGAWSEGIALRVRVLETDFSHTQEFVNYVKVKDEAGTELQHWQAVDLVQPNSPGDCPEPYNWVEVLLTNVSEYTGTSFSVEVQTSKLVGNWCFGLGLSLIAEASTGEFDTPVLPRTETLLEYDAGDEIAANSFYLTWYNSSEATTSLDVFASSNGEQWRRVESLLVNTGTDRQEVLFMNGMTRSRYWRFAIPSLTIAVAGIQLRMFTCLDANDAPICHQLASCVAEKTCECPHGTIDPTASEGYKGDGASCLEHGFAVRYVVNEDVTGEGLAQVQQSAKHDVGRLCLNNSQGFFARGVPDISSGDNLDGVDALWAEERAVMEINCLYAPNKRPDDAELAAYGTGSGLWAWAASDRVNVPPAVYVWALSSSSSPILVPPTGMEVNSVSFNNACEASGCWVITGKITTGNAFNSYEAFNTFFLPHAVSPDPTGDLSYDHPYSDEAWTFSPANHPCTSGQFEADDQASPDMSVSQRLARISTCCIQNDATNRSGGFVANYRPSKAFEDFWGTAPGCTPKVVQRPRFSRPPQNLRKCYNIYEHERDMDDILSSPGGKDYNGAVAACALRPGGRLAVADNTDEEAVLAAMSLYPTTQSPVWFHHIETSPSKSTLVGPRWPCLGTVNGFLSGMVCEVVRPYICEETRGSASCDSDTVGSEIYPYWDIAFPSNYLDFLKGPFKGMPESAGVVKLEATDHFFGQYGFEIHLDEVELRSLAGKLRGTVGVEYTVDTFLGFANFRPTGFAALDTFATQTNIHLEKTNFFSVSTHGANQYTFLEYVNMRLVTVYDQDTDFSDDVDVDNNNDDDNETFDRTVRASADGNAAFVQVTFTLGVGFAVNDNPNSDPYSSGLIPLDSVRVGRGSFLDDVEAAGGMQHTCREYNSAGDTTRIGLDLGSGAGRMSRKAFDDIVAQSCGPQSSMCASPSSVPDAFVSFNIPLGTEIFDDDVAASELSSSIFVSMVVNALDDAGAGTSKGSDGQLKTTLSASIPITAAGINIFCDGVTAKTDLKDVASVDIVVGTAANNAELSRLRIVEGIASTNMAAVESAEINTASFESALMTLVIKGSHDYFRDINTNTGGFALELEDVITLHLMEDGGAGSVDAMGQATNSKETEVLRLLGLPGADSSDANVLDTDGYALNSAFEFWIDRASSQAHLELTAALLKVCSFNPTRPGPGSFAMESCIARRDVRSREYPSRLGAAATAVEVLAASRAGAAPKDSEAGAVAAHASALAKTSAESDFMATVLGDDDYSRGLAIAFAEVIRSQYELNGRYRRAFWINPGYEWTPAQTAGASLFSVSQKVYLFALISLDENWQRRRMLLQSGASSSLEDNSAGVNAAAISFGVTPKQLMASAFGVPEDHAAIYTVTLALTEAEACMSPTARQSAVRDTFVDYLSQTASAFHTVQVTKMSVDLGSVQCVLPAARRAARHLLASLSDATAEIEMLVVFTASDPSVFNPAAFARLPGVLSLEPAANNSPKIQLDGAYKCTGSDCGEAPPASEPGTPNVPLIAGAAVAGAGAVAVVVGAMLYKRSRREEAEAVSAAQTVNVADLKAQLASEV